MVMEAKNVKLDCKCDTTNESGSIHETVFPSASRIDNLGSSLQTCVPETSYHSVTGQKHVRSSIERQNSCASKSSFSRSRSPSSEGSEACLRSRSRHYKDGKSRRKISPQRVCKRRSESPLRRRRKVSSSGSSSHTSREFRHRSRSPLRQEYRRGRSSRSRSPPRRNQRHRPSESSSSSPLHRRNGSESPLRHKRNRNDRLLSREGYRSYEGRSPSAHHLDTRRNRSRFELSSRDSVRVSSMQQKFVERRPGSPHRRPSQNIRNSSGQSRAVSTRYTRGRSNPPQFEQSMPRELKILLNDARYFLIRSSNFDNLLLAKSESVWSTPPHNETRLNDAFRTSSNVLLVFCVKETNAFQGYARISAESTRMYPPLPWVLPVGLSAKSLSGVFTIDWIARNEVSFSRARHLCNAMNMNRPVAFGRDGQEIESSAGGQLCRLFDVDLSSADVQRTVQKSMVTQQLRGLDTNKLF